MKRYPACIFISENDGKQEDHSPAVYASKKNLGKKRPTGSDVIRQDMKLRRETKTLRSFYHLRLPGILHIDISRYID